MTRVCSKCKRELPATLEYFSSRKRNKDGLHELCKICRAARDRQYRIEHRERYLETTKAWKEANAEHIQKVNAIYTATHKARKSETNRIWHINNKDRKNAMVKQWAAENKERRNQTIIAWRDGHKEDYLAIAKRYRDANPDKQAMWAERRRAAKKNLPSTLTEDEWQQIKLHFDNKCAYCGADGKLTQEHFIAVANGGGYTSDNIIPACAKCNFSKKQKPFDVWYPKQDFYSAEREAEILKAVAGNAVQSSQSA